MKQEFEDLKKGQDHQTRVLKKNISVHLLIYLSLSYSSTSLDVLAIFGEFI